MITAILKQAYNFLKYYSAILEKDNRYIVIDNGRMLIISSKAIVSVNLKHYLSDSEISYLNDKYISFNQLEFIKKAKAITFDKEGFIIDANLVPYNGHKTGETTAYQISYCFSEKAAELGVYHYETKEGILDLPIGFSKYLLEKCQDAECSQMRNIIPINADTLFNIKNIIDTDKFGNGIIVELVSFIVINNNMDFYRIVPNTENYFNKDNYAIMVQATDKRN